MMAVMANTRIGTSKKAPTSAKATATPPKAAPKQAASAAAKGWQASTPRKTVTRAATEAVMKAIATGKSTGHPALEKFGKALGLGLGVLVTEALATQPKWNKPVLDAAGKPVKSIEGATRIGNHDLLARHQEVVGPKIAALVSKLPDGALHDLLKGLGEGASQAPGASYRLEAKLADKLHG
jgi:hypothetical protein